MNSLDKTTLTLASFCIIRSGKKSYAFTDAPEDVQLDGLLFKCNNGFSRSALTGNRLTNVDNFEVYGVIDSDDITANEIESGILIGAEIEVFIADYTLESNEKFSHKTGLIDAITMKDGTYIFQIRSLLDKFNQEIGQTYSPKCRACFGDKHCKVELSKYTFEADVIEIKDKDTLIINIKSEQQINLRDGMFICQSGGIFRIIEHIGNVITILNPYNFSIELGSGYNVRLGCDKNFETCISKFNNAVNFRGEPHIPNVSQNLNW